MSGRVAIEIAVQDIVGVRIALVEGVDRIELCSALSMGGLTPSAGLIAAAVERAQAARRAGFVHVLVRPRGGGFVYDADEVALAESDIGRAREAGADGVVIGALDERTRVDVPTVSRLLEAAGGMEVTFHRAIDVTGDPLGALDQLAELGIDRVLTSGGAPRCSDGLAGLRALAQRAGDRLQVMAGGGVRVEDIPRIAATGAAAVHLSARDSVVGAPSGPGGGSAAYDITDAALVRDAVAATHLAS